MKLVYMRNFLLSKSCHGVYVSYIIVLIPITSILFAFEYAPLQDFSEWIYQAQVFNALLMHGHSELFTIKTYPVPYALSQILMSFMYIFFSPFVTSKIVICIYILSGLFLTRMFISRFDLDESVASLFLLSAFVLNSCFWDGYIGYQIGLAIFVLYLCLPPQKKTSALFIFAFSVASFFSHGLIYVPFCLVCGMYCVYNWKIKSLVLGLLPSIVLLTWYVLINHASTSAEPIVLNGFVQFFFYKIYTFLKAGPYHNFIVNGVGDSQRLRALYIFGILVNVSFLLALVLCLASAIRSNRLMQFTRNAEMMSALILVVIMLALPATLAGIVNPGERLLYPALILASCVLFKKDRMKSISGNSMAAILITGLVISMVNIAALSLTRAEGTSATAIAINGSARNAEGRELFGHRLQQFDEKIREAQRSWKAGDIPTLPLAFDTGLIEDRKTNR
jgi:hypothetical protein